MDLIKTKSFELAVINRGDKSADNMAIFLPGRMDTKDYAYIASHLDLLASKGFFAISFDPPGTWESPGGNELFNTTNYIKAVNELIDYFGNKPTLLLGHSRGGQVAMLVGTSNSNVTGMVLINASYGPPSPPSAGDIKTGYVVEFRDMPPGNIRTSDRKKFILSLDYFSDGAKYDPLPFLKACAKPKLIIYSTEDAFTEVDEIKKLYDKFQEPKMIHELKSIHDYRYQPLSVNEVNETIKHYLASYF